MSLELTQHNNNNNNTKSENNNNSLVVMISTAATKIHRVVTTFILTTTSSTKIRPPEIAIFHRCDTMPSFPSHWAGISGTIEADETPYQAAQRELREETNLTQTVEPQGGLYMDVPYVSPRRPNDTPSIIRVYPFVVYVPTPTNTEESANDKESEKQRLPLELLGTEHDDYRLVSIQELESMESQCVPGLVQAFHHATFGRYHAGISQEIRDWASDVQNGASVMTQKAIQLALVAEKKKDNHEKVRTAAEQIAMLRPTMVPIVNAMREISTKNGGHAITPESFARDLQAGVDLGTQALNEIFNNKEQPQDVFTIATFSRSGTLRKVLESFLTETPPGGQKCKVVCGQSTPGNEGELMAQDLGTDWVTDATLQAWLAGTTSTEPSRENNNPNIHALVIGADCILPKAGIMINKVGTRKLCEIANQQKIPVLCCADRWKLWDDIFPPPLEDELFEIVPLDLITNLAVPSMTCRHELEKE